jgi:cell division protein FtsQ
MSPKPATGRSRAAAAGGGWRSIRPRRVLLAAGAVVVVGGAVTAWSLAGVASRQDLADPMAGGLERLSRSLGLTVDEILVVGRAETPRPALLKALGAGFGDPILAVDLHAARDRILALPWVSAAEVERALPNTLIIRLSERTPVAVWQHRGQFTLIDREGRALAEDGDGVQGDLIVIVGEDAPPEAGALLDLLATQPDVEPLVKAAVRVGGRRWNLHLDNGISIRLPEADAAEALKRLAGYHRTQKLLDRNLTTIDLRFSDKLILQPSDARPGDAKPGDAKPGDAKPGGAKPAKGNSA